MRVVPMGVCDVVCLRCLVAGSGVRYQVFVDATPCKATEVVKTDVIRCVGVPPLLRPMRANISIGFDRGAGSAADNASVAIAAALRTHAPDDRRAVSVDSMVVVHQPSVHVEVSGFAVESVDPSIAAPGATLTVHGSGFPVAGTSPHFNDVLVAIGDRPCASTRVVSATEVLCVGVPEGSGANHVVTVFVAGVATIPNVTDADDSESARAGKSPFFTYAKSAVVAIGVDEEHLDVDGGATITLAVRGLAPSNLVHLSPPSSTSMITAPGYEVNPEGQPASSFPQPPHNDANLLLMWSHEAIDVGDWPVLVSAHSGAMRVCTRLGDVAVSERAAANGERRIACRAGPGWGEAFVALLPSTVVEALLALGPEQVFGTGGVRAWHRARLNPAPRFALNASTDPAAVLSNSRSDTLNVLRSLVGVGTTASNPTDTQPKIATVQFAAPNVRSLETANPTLRRTGGTPVLARGRNLGAPIPGASATVGEGAALHQLFELRDQLAAGLARLPGPVLETALAEVLNVLTVHQLNDIVAQHTWRPLPVSFHALRRYQQSIGRAVDMQFRPRPLSQVVPPLTPVCGDVEQYNESVAMWRRQYGLVANMMHDVLAYKLKIDAAACSMWATVSPGADGLSLIHI